MFKVYFCITSRSFPGDKNQKFHFKHIKSAFCKGTNLKSVPWAHRQYPKHTFSKGVNISIKFLIIVSQLM